MTNKEKNRQMLEYLLTSDFNENYKKEKYISLLKQLRYFYRLLYGKMNLNKDEKDSQINKLKTRVKNLEKDKNQEKVKNAKLTDNLNKLKNRKLTLKERLSGKINKDKI